MSGSLQIEEIPDSAHEVAYTGENPRVKNKITCTEQIEEVLDDSDQRQNNPLNDSNYQLISEIDIIEHKIEVKSEEDNVLIHPTTAGITDPEFVDCGETIKHEIKEEGDSEYQIDPLRLFNTPQSSDQSVHHEKLNKLQSHCILCKKFKSSKLSRHIFIPESNISLCDTCYVLFLPPPPSQRLFLRYI